MQIIKKIKNVGLTILELAHVRLEMVRVELNQQKQLLFTTLVLCLLSFVFFLVAFISLLFGLNTVLDLETKKIVFFSISGVALVLILIFLWLILRGLRKQQDFMVSTLTEVKKDIQMLKISLKHKPNTNDEELL